MYKWAFKLKKLFIEEHTIHQDELIERLNKEHKKLFNLYTQICITKKPKKRLKLLTKFYYEYHLHIIKEDKQLYTSLLNRFSYVKDKKEFVVKKQEEMKGITEFIENFAKKYSTVEALETEEFKTDLDTLGNALTERVKFEEYELYELYEYYSPKTKKS